MNFRIVSSDSVMEKCLKSSPFCPEVREGGRRAGYSKQDAALIVHSAHRYVIGHISGKSCAGHREMRDVCAVCSCMQLVLYSSHRFPTSNGVLYPSQNCRTSKKTKHWLCIEGDLPIWPRRMEEVQVNCKENVTCWSLRGCRYWVKDMRERDRLIKWGNIHVFSGKEWRFSRNLGPGFFLLHLWFFLVIVMATVNCHGAGVCVV